MWNWKGIFKPNELGFIITDLLVKNFPDIVDVDFTARLENDLDRVESAEMDAKHLLEKFYEVFETRVLAAAQEMLSVKGVGLPTGIDCPVCGREVRIKVKTAPSLPVKDIPIACIPAITNGMKRGRSIPSNRSMNWPKGRSVISAAGTWS